MPVNITIKPNVPIYIALADPEGDSANFNFDLRIGQYHTVDGRVLALPEAGCMKLNELSPRPGEEVQITKLWSGKAGEPSEWSICLSIKSEQARAEAGEPDTLMKDLQASFEASESRRANTEPPTPIRRPAKREPVPEVQPKLFDRQKGTGTYGPAPEPAAMPIPALPLPAVASGKRQPPAIIPWNVAFREVSAWVSKELQQNNLQWSDEAQQAMVCTVLIAEAKAGRVGPWERGSK